MSIIYESRRLPVNFRQVDTGGSELLQRDSSSQIAYPILAGPRNGALATCALITSIIENEHWLTFRDTPMINFFDVAGNGDNFPGATSAWTNSSKTIKLILPPYCRFASLHFLCARNFGADTELAYIQVDSDIHTVVNTSIPWGEDLAALAKSGLSYFSADWVHFAGIDIEASGGPTALRITADDDMDQPTWRHREVTITVSANCNVYAAAYRVLPAVGTLPAQFGAWPALA